MLTLILTKRYLLMGRGMLGRYSRRRPEGIYGDPLGRAPTSFSISTVDLIAHFGGYIWVAIPPLSGLA
jgi:hypothetical protein